MKKYFAISLLVIPIVLPTMTFVQKELCACITVNASVVGQLNSFERSIDEYAKTNNGRYPSYDELIALLEERNPRIPEDMVTDIEIFKGEYRGPFGKKYRHKFGYSVSDDRNQYILKGIGETINVLTFQVFGKNIKIPLGRTYPILSPEDTPPYPSPFS